MAQVREGSAAYITQHSPVRRGASVARVQHGLNAGLVILCSVHASDLQVIRAQNLPLAVDSGVLLRGDSCAQHAS